MLNFCSLHKGVCNFFSLKTCFTLSILHYRLTSVAFRSKKWAIIESFPAHWNFNRSFISLEKLLCLLLINFNFYCNLNFQNNFFFALFTDSKLKWNSNQFFEIVKEIEAAETRLFFFPNCSRVSIKIPFTEEKKSFVSSH